MLTILCGYRRADTVAKRADPEEQREGALPQVYAECDGVHQGRVSECRGGPESVDTRHGRHSHHHHRVQG